MPTVTFDATAARQKAEAAKAAAEQAAKAAAKAASDAEIEAQRVEHVGSGLGHVAEQRFALLDLGAGAGEGLAHFERGLPGQPVAIGGEGSGEPLQERGAFGMGG